MDDTGIAIFSKKEDLAPDLKASNVETTRRKVRRDFLLMQPAKKY